MEPPRRTRFGTVLYLLPRPQPHPWPWWPHPSRIRSRTILCYKGYGHHRRFWLVVVTHIKRTQSRTDPLPTTATATIDGRGGHTPRGFGLRTILCFQQLRPPHPLYGPGGYSTPPSLTLNFSIPTALVGCGFLPSSLPFTLHPTAPSTSFTPALAANSTSPPHPHLVSLIYTQRLRPLPGPGAQLSIPYRSHAHNGYGHLPLPWLWFVYISSPLRCTASNRDPPVRWCWLRSFYVCGRVEWSRLLSQPSLICAQRLRPTRLAVTIVSYSSIYTFLLSPSPARPATETHTYVGAGYGPPTCVGKLSSL